MLDRLAVSPQRLKIAGHSRRIGREARRGEVTFMRQVLSIMVLMLRLLPDATKQGDGNQWDDWGAK